MNQEDFKEIEDIVEDKNYKERNETKYKSIRVAGITANLINIGLMFNVVLFIFQSWTNEFDFFGKSLIVTLFVLFLLSIAEYLKRFLIYEAFLNSYINNWKTGFVSFKSKVQLVIAGIIIIVSGFTAINGSKQLADKSDIVEVSTDNSYNLELQKLQDKKDLEDSKTKTLYDSKISNSPSFRVEDIEKFTNLKNKALQANQEDYNNSKSDLDKKFSKVTNRSKSSNNYIVLGSYLFTFLIELGIVFALFFESKYKWQSYLEEKERLSFLKLQETEKKLKSSESWKTYQSQKRLLKEIYTYYKTGETMSSSKLSKILKSRNLNFSKTFIDSLYDLLYAKGAVGEDKYNKRPFLLEEQEAFDLLKEHYGFKNIVEEI